MSAVNTNQPLNLDITLNGEKLSESIEKAVRQWEAMDEHKGLIHLEFPNKLNRDERDRLMYSISHRSIVDLCTPSTSSASKNPQESTKATLNISQVMCAKTPKISHNTGVKTKRKRFPVTNEMISFLEQVYRQHKYLRGNMPILIAIHLGIYVHQVKHWFRIRRRKEKNTNGTIKK